MAKFGNLYWEIQFTALYHGGTDCCVGEQVRIAVQGHDFADTYKKARAMHDVVLKTHPDRIHNAVVYLRDDGSVEPGVQYKIYTDHYIFDEKVAAFFSAGADKCLRLARRM